MHKIFTRQKTPAEAVSLISGILKYNPDQRLKPMEALQHKFFDELRLENTKLPNGQPLPELFTFSKEEIAKLISSKDINEFGAYCHEDVDESDLLQLLNSKIETDNFTSKTVLGIDIYNYSQYKPLEQSLIPILFKLIYDKASVLCKSDSSFIFQNYEQETFIGQFIDTGDGGFQIFDTPIHAMAFAINFQMIVRYYNSFRYFPKLRKIIGPLGLRYAMTHDKIYKFNNNYFGPSIINNSRILNVTTCYFSKIKSFMINVNIIVSIYFFVIYERQ